ncbi:MAG: hypothetical protein QOF02_3073 [Blastocatellia bacterium]|jgi:hypothetical protein|nr:hypothetical protein [Blastocatellia bacterium]
MCQFPPRKSFSARRTAAGALFTMALLLTALLAASVATAQAQSATIYGALSNFDVINHTEHEAHGFEVEFEGLHPEDVYYTFSAQRYGSPTIIPTTTGVRVRWASAYDYASQLFLQTTVAHAPNTSFAGTCYQWGGASYATSGCEHFGVSLRANAVKTTYRWLIADAQTPGQLVAVDPPVAIPSPVYVALPPAQEGEAPLLEAEIEAPEPAEAPEVYGNAQWVKVFKTELLREVTLDELVSDNVIVPQDAAHAEVSWEILQDEPASNGNGSRNRRQNQGSLSAGTRAVVRRYEIYQYTGAYDPTTHEALCADGLCNAPQDGEVGDYIGAQMAAANVAVPSVTVAKNGSGSGNVSSSDRNISCGSKCSLSYNAGTVVTLTASPSSNSVFAGWGGACDGNQLTCTVTVNEALNVTATFSTPTTLSIKTSGKGTVTGAQVGIDCGKNCSATVAQGTVVTLTAAPASGYKFLNWTGGGCSGSALTCTLPVTKSAQVQANFGK